MTVATVPSPTSLLLRTCGAGFTAHGGFVWSSTVGATVRPVRWDPAAVCGDGLHGFLHGEGSGDFADWSESAEWLVIETPTADIVHLDGKVKCPVTTVAHVGQGATAFDRRLDAIAFLVSRGQCGMGCVGRVLTGGNGSTLTGGDRSTLTGQWWDGAQGRYRRRLFTVGENGILPNVAYRMDAAGMLVCV